MSNELITKNPIYIDDLKRIINLENAKIAFNQMDITENTKKDYGYRIPQFIEFVYKNKLHKNTYLDYKNYLNVLNPLQTANHKKKKRIKDRFLSISTKNKYLITAKVYLMYLYSESIIPLDITKKAKIFKQESSHTRDGFTSDQVQTMTDYISGLDNGLYNLRLKALFTMLAFQGVRQIECHRLNIQDIDFNKGIANISPKGGGRRRIQLTKYTVYALQQYITATGSMDGAVFKSFSNKNRTNNESRLTTTGIQIIFRSVFKALNIKGFVHGFRHHIVGFLHKNKFDIFDIMAVTGHTSLETIKRYLDEIKKKSNLVKTNKAIEAGFIMPCLA